VFIYPKYIKHHKSIVGASLLAMRPAPSTSMPPDTPPSRAGSLPQGVFIYPKYIKHHKSIVGASLLAMRPAQSINAA
ncbi:hypothetical protein ACCT23_05395, partial [Pseudomonas corrugata]